MEQEKKKLSTRIKEFALNYSEGVVAEYDKNPLQSVQNSWYLIKFLFNIAITLTLFTISGFNISFKYYANGGFNTKLYILLAANAVNLVLIFIYFITYRTKIKHGDPTLKCEEALAYTKFFIKLIKVIIPVMLLMTLVETPIWKITTIIISGFSVITGFISFMIAVFKLARFRATKEKKLAKKQKKFERDQKFNTFYVNARNKKQAKENNEENTNDDTNIK